jgi:hypothetical protein
MLYRGPCLVQHVSGIIVTILSFLIQNLLNNFLVANIRISKLSRLEISNKCSFIKRAFDLLVLKAIIIIKGLLLLF